ncbi:MAG: ferritin family protein, partial [Rhodoplanes sp.]
MKRLNTEPRQPVRSMDELFGILQAMEHQAAARYEALGIRMYERGADEVASVFRRLAEEEREHERVAARWLEGGGGKAQAAVVDSRTLPDPTEADEMTAAIGVDRQVTPYAAFSLAVRGEERAFAYWSYVSAHARDSGIKAAAEGIAHEELAHAALLRRERRRAYHIERGRTQPSAGGPKSALALLRAAEASERRLGDALHRLASAPEQTDRVAAEDLAAQSYRMAGELRGLIGGTASSDSEAPSDAEAPVVTEDVDAPLAAQADDLVERY